MPSPSSSNSTPQRPLQILCLHGLTENAQIMEKKLAPVMKLLSSPNDSIKFTFVSAPYILPQIRNVDTHQGFKMTLKANTDKHMEDHKSDEAKMKEIQEACFAISYHRAIEEYEYAEERRNKKINLKCIPKLREKYIPRLDKVDSDIKAKVEGQIYDQHGSGKRWWTIPNELKGKDSLFIGQEASFQVISKAMREEGPFDGVIGFSTGAMLASFCQSLLSGSTPMETQPTFQPPPTQKAFKFALYFAPWLPASGPYLDLLNRLEGQDITASIPTMCFQGVKDASVAKGSCNRFAELNRAERFEYHNGGHSIPFWDAYPVFLASWLSIAAKEARGQLGKKEAKQMRLRLVSPFQKEKKQEEARL